MCHPFFIRNSREHMRAFVIQKSHTSQMTQLPSSSHNHHLNHHLPPRHPHVTSTSTNIPGHPQTTTTAQQPYLTITRPCHQCQQQQVRPPRRPLPCHAMPSSPQATPATQNASTAQTTTCVKKATSGKRWPAPNKQHRLPSNNENHQQQLSNAQGARATPGLNRQAGAGRS